MKYENLRPPAPSQELIKKIEQNHPGMGKAWAEFKASLAYAIKEGVL